MSIAAVSYTHLDHAPLNIGEDDRFAVGAELEVGVRPAAFRGGAILLGSENDEIAVRRDGAALRETPLDQLIRAVAERVVGSVSYTHLNRR